MKATFFASMIAGLMLLAASCAAPVEDSAAGAAVTQTSEALTLQECATQRDMCFRRYPIFGLFTCPAQYAQCTATASNGIPAQVTAAISDATECARDAASCRGDANTPAALLACTTEEAACVGAIIDAQIPEVVTGTAECLESAVGCITGSDSVSDLNTCATTLETCAINEVLSNIPPEVGVVVEDVAACTLALGDCTDAAATPSELTACSEDYVVCVGDGLGVDLPNVPVSEAMACAEDAASCTLDSSSLADIGACADGYVDCTTALVQQQLTCEQRFNQCLAQNPFNFLVCGAQLLTCRD
jgi:hypothetical protein